MASPAPPWLPHDSALPGDAMMLICAGVLLLLGAIAGSGLQAAEPPPSGAATPPERTPQGPVAAIELVHDWPSYLGPNGNFTESSGAALLDDLNDARLVWISQEKRMGYGKQPEGGYPKLYPQFGDLPPGGAATPILADGLLLHAHFIPSGDVWAKDIAALLGEKEFVKQRWLVAADDAMIAVDGRTGRTVWKQIFPGKGLNVPNIKYGGYGLTPAADGGRVFMVGTTGRVYALEVASGKLLWETTVGPRHEALEKLKAECLAEWRLSEGRGSERRLDMLGGLLVVDGVLVAPDLEKGLVGIDTRDGRTLWHQAGPLTSGYNLPCPVEANGSKRILTVNAIGEMRLIDPRSGKIFWMHPLKSQHLTQPVASGDHVLVFDAHPSYRSPDPKAAEQEQALGDIKRYGLLAAYRVDEGGARRAWRLPDDYVQMLHMDAGPARRVIPRDGVIYYVATWRGERKQSRLVVVRDADGKILSDQETAYPHLSVWGDRLVMPNDIQHRPAPWRPEIWQLFTLDAAGPRPLGQPWKVNTQERSIHLGDGGYEVPVLEVFADGLMYCRVMGGFRCYDLRAGGKNP